MTAASARHDVRCTLGSAAHHIAVDHGLGLRDGADVHFTRVRDAAAMQLGAPRIESLTLAQREFAEHNQAVPAVRSAQDPRMVFMYRDEPRRTSRWLVDEAGEVVDSAMFHRRPTRAVRSSEIDISAVISRDRPQ